MVEISDGPLESGNFDNSELAFAKAYELMEEARKTESPLLLLMYNHDTKSFNFIAANASVADGIKLLVEGMNVVNESAHDLDEDRILN